MARDLTPSDVGRLLRSQHRVGRLRCVVCGAEMEGELGRRLYCSNRCKLAARRARLKAAGAHPQGETPHPTP